MLRPEGLPPVQYEVTPLQGGYDQITSAYNLTPGALRDCINFACRSQGGYYRVPGYERLDGRPSPSAATFITIDVTMSPGQPIPPVGSVGSFGNVTGTVCYVDPYGEYVAVTKSIVTFATFTPGPINIGAGNIGVATGIHTQLTLKQNAIIKASAANIYRADIQVVPGSGPIRGVVYFKDTTYAFRDNAAATGLDIYKSTSAGWVKVELGSIVKFDQLTAEPPNSSGIGTWTITQGAVTATVTRFVVEGTTGNDTNQRWNGRILISSVTGGTLSTGAFTIVGGALDGETGNLLAPPVPVTLLPGGKYNFSIGNFSGYYDNERVYGADGVNDGFEFDGATYVPIPVDAQAKPSYAIVHSNHLFFAVESSLIHSALGNPYNFEVVNGAGEIGTGGKITGLLILPGNQGTAALEVTSRSSTWVLYGTSAQDWKFVNYNVGVGALDRTLQNLFDAFSADDHGITMMKQSLNYGNFDAARLTYNIQPFITSLVGQLACSALSRSNSQYRVYYANGFGIYTTATPQGIVGHGVVLFPDPVICSFDGENSNGRSVHVFGTSTGYVMQNDSGTSFDGAQINAYLNTNINTAKSPRIRKRFRRCVLELQGGNYVEMRVGYAFEWASEQILPHAFEEGSVSFSALSFWDTFTWDSFYWDGRSNDVVSVELEGTGENLQMMIVVDSDYVEQFTIPSAIFHYTQRRGNR